MISSANRSLAWKLNWFRQSELEGALLLGKMVRTVGDPWLVEQLTQHCSEEAVHSHLWSRVIRELGLPTIRIVRSYQSFYLEKTGYPTDLLDVLCFTQIFEKRVHQRFISELKRSGTPEPARQAYEQMIDDEKGHLNWVAKWLRMQPEASQRLYHFEAIDKAVFEELKPFEESLWSIQNLGIE
jgi:hypothetical protein